MIEYLRLAFGTFVVLVPGMAVARALRTRSVAAMFAWALASVFVAWAVVFTVHRSIHLAVAMLAAITLVALIVGRRESIGLVGARAPVWIFGVVLGWFMWHVESPVVGDGLFHEARVRKLVDLTSLHLRTVDEFKDGGLHPGYAFPLWHGFLALVSWFSGVDPEQVVRHEPSLLAPLACVLVFEAGVAVLGSRRLGAAVLAAQLALVCFGPGHGGSFAVLSLPATASRQLMVPAAITLFFGARTWRGYAAVVAIFGALTLTHPTYGVFVLVPLLAVTFWYWRAWLVALVPIGLVLLWLRPIVDETLTHDPSASTRAADLAQYGSQLVVSSDRHFRLAAEVFGRSGSVAVATLFLLPVIGLALRTTLGGFHARRKPDRAAADARPLAVRAHLGCGVAVAVSPPRGIHSVPVCVRGDRGARRTPEARRSGRARRRNRPAEALARRLRVRTQAWWARSRDVGRPRRRSSVARPLPRAPPAAPARAPHARPCGRVRIRAARPRAQRCALEPRPEVRPARALAEARPQPAHEGAEGSHRPRSARHELSRCSERSGLHRRRTGRARGEHEGQRPVRTRACRSPLGLDERSPRGQAVRRDLADSQRPAFPASARATRRRVVRCGRRLRATRLRPEMER